jgi:Flp pilus assembly protein TadG
MNLRKSKSRRISRGQSLVETALMLPLLIMIVLNVVNLGYFFLVIVNLTGAARTATEYAIIGASTTASPTLPSPGPANGTPNGNLTIAYLTQQDMTGALANPTAATTLIQICTSALGLNPSGQAKCQTCSGTTCQSAVNTGTPAQGTDPETNFVLNEVDITYQFSTLIPGKIFNIPLQASAMCNSGTCTFTRRAMMRAMN